MTAFLVRVPRRHLRGRAIAERRLSLEDSRRVLALAEVLLTAPHAVVGHLRDYL
jgi:uncharacterized protein (DUF2384 family)